MAGSRSQRDPEASYPRVIQLKFGPNTGPAEAVARHPQYSARSAERLPAPAISLLMHEVRLLDPAGMVMEIYPGAGDPACAVTRARILLETRPEMAGAQVRDPTGIIEVACGMG